MVEGKEEDAAAPTTPESPGTGLGLLGAAGVLASLTPERGNTGEQHFDHGGLDLDVEAEELVMGLNAGAGVDGTRWLHGHTSGHEKKPYIHGLGSLSEARPRQLGASLLGSKMKRER